MITGAIALVVLIAVLPPAINNGEWWVAVVAVVIALFLIVLGITSRESDRAYLNVTRYWANGRSDSRSGVKRRKNHKYVPEDEEETEAPVWCPGDACPLCKGKVVLAANMNDHGVPVKLYMCTKCGKNFRTRVYGGNSLD